MKHLNKICIALFALLFASTSQMVYAQSAPSFNDAEIASIAVTANDIDIKYGELALTKTKNKEITNFAKTMINDHKAVIQQAVDLVTKLKVTPQDNALSKQLNADAETTRKMLSSKKGAAFNKAYIDNEVAYHEAVIGAVKDVLIPQSQNAELKALLEAVLPALETHLEHAKMVQKNIGG